MVRQALTESVLLGLMGGAAGIAVAYGGTRLVLWMAFSSAHFLPISRGPFIAGAGFALGLSC